MAFHISNSVASAEMNALTARLNTGYLRIYSGTRPATADTALSGNTLLAELRFASTAFGAAANGVATANAITSATAAATATASFFRALQSDGTTAEGDGDVATSGSDLNLNSVAIQVGATVAVSSMVLTQPK